MNICYLISCYNSAVRQIDRAGGSIFLDKLTKVLDPFSVAYKLLVPNLGLKLRLLKCSHHNEKMLQQKLQLLDSQHLLQQQLKGFLAALVCSSCLNYSDSSQSVLPLLKKMVIFVGILNSVDLFHIKSEKLENGI